MMISGETTALNVIQRTPVKTKGSEQQDNVPAKQVIARAQSITNQVKEKQKDVEKETEKLKDKLETKKNLERSDIKQTDRVVNSLNEQTQALTGQLDQLISLSGYRQNAAKEEEAVSSEDQPSIIVTFGYVGEAERALNALQEQLTKLQKLQREMNKAILDAQRGEDTLDDQGNIVHKRGTIEAIADSVAYSARLEGVGKWLEAGQQGAQAILSGINMRVTSKRSEELQKSLNGPGGASTELNGVKAFKGRFEEAMEGEAVIGNEALPQLDDNDRQLLRDIPEGRGPYTAQADVREEKVLPHIKADDQSRRRTRKALSEQIHAAELRRNSELTQHQVETQTTSMIFDLGKQGFAAAASGLQGVNDIAKGHTNAQEKLAQYASDQQNQAVSGGVQQAQEIDNEARQLNQQKEKINAQTQ